MDLPQQNSAPDAPLTPATEAGIRAFFDGLCGISETIERGMPAMAAMGITPSLYELVKVFCGNDERFQRVMGSIWVVNRSQLMPQKQSPPGFKTGLAVGIGLTTMTAILLKLFA